MKPLFVFDLDSTITRCELLPLLAREVGMEAEMAARTEAAMRGECGFEADFRSRVELLRGIPVSRAREIVRRAPLHGRIAAFLRENAGRCCIVTGNLDVWIEGLIEDLGMSGRCLCSRGRVEGDRLLGVEAVLGKGAAVLHLPRPFAAVGDGENDIPMLERADMGIAFGGARRLSPRVRGAADRVVFSEAELCALLEGML